jgi:site-specific DNA recombinase
MTTAVYARISKDRGGQGLGVERQLEACRHLAAAKGWQIADDWVITENDTSAATAKIRPGFERLIRGMERGEVHAVLALKVDRLVRRMPDMVRLWDVAKRLSVLVATVDGDLDLTTSTGRQNAVLFGALAEIEIERLTGRLEDKALQQVKAGKNANAGSRPFGWNLRRTEHHPVEAAVIRELADRLIKGESLSSVARDLNKRKVPTSGYRDRAIKGIVWPGPAPRWIRWDVRKLRQVLSNERHAGRVEHRGEVVCDETTGLPVKAQWQPILEPDVFDRLQAALQARRVVSDVWTGERRHLLSGTLLRCGVCGQKVLPIQQTGGKHAYRCRGHLARNRDRTDEHVLAMVRQRIAENPITLASLRIERGTDPSAEIEEIERTLAEMDEDWYANRGSVARYARVTAQLEADLVRLKADKSDRVAVETGLEWVVAEPHLLESSGSLLPKDDPRKASLIEKQRFAIQLYVRQIHVFPTSMRGRFFDSDSIKIDWRDLSRFRPNMRYNEDTGEFTIEGGNR